MPRRRNSPNTKSPILVFLLRILDMILERTSGDTLSVICVENSGGGGGINPLSVKVQMLQSAKNTRKQISNTDRV